MLPSAVHAAPQDAVPAPASADAEAVRARAEADYARLAAEAATRAGDPAFDYALGIAALDTGRYGEAIIALQRVLAVSPANAAARAELARAYALAGDIDTAREQFATVVDDPSLPDPVRQRFTGFVRGLDKQIRGGGSDISGFVDARVGHDSNINSATELNSIVIPLFSFLGPGQLGGGARAQSDSFYDIIAGVSGVTAISRQDRLFGSVLANWRDNFDSDTFDQAALTATAGYAHSFANQDVISISAQAQEFWLGRNGFRSALGVTGQYTKALAGGKAVTLSAGWNRLDFDGDPLRDADRYSASVGFVGKLFVVGLTGGKEETLREAGDNLSFRFVTANVGAEVPLTKRLAMVAGAGFDLRRHDEADPLFLTRRKDERVDLQAGLKVALTDRLFLQPTATWSRNWSNIALFDFERWTLAVGARFEF
jgi:tetratricopeptide (TPR) repeat protein